MNFEFELMSRSEKGRPSGNDDFVVTNSCIRITRIGLEKMGIPISDSFLINLLIDSKNGAIALQIPQNDAERKASYKFTKAKKSNSWLKSLSNTQSVLDIKIAPFIGCRGQLTKLEGTRFWVFKKDEVNNVTNDRESVLDEVME